MVINPKQIAILAWLLSNYRHKTSLLIVNKLACKVIVKLRKIKVLQISSNKYCD